MIKEGTITCLCLKKLNRWMVFINSISSSLLKIWKTFMQHKNNYQDQQLENTVVQSISGLSVALFRNR